MTLKTTDVLTELPPDDTLSTINQYLNGDVETLNANDQKYYENLVFAYNQLWANPSREYAVKRIMKMKNLKRSQAYKYVSEAIDTFTPYTEINKKFERIWILTDIKKDLIAANSIQDATKRYATKEKLQRNFILVAQLDKEETQKINPQDLGNNIYITVHGNLTSNQAVAFNWDLAGELSEAEQTQILQEVWPDAQSPHTIPIIAADTNRD